ncbi:MAG: NAD-dependent dehydratase [Bdellovibrionales bacterium CG10_big_fil_rev_8_21_14_0_10_45_34]|nr:MAG: NAD-dependent dehydratase [Bdellovibrionales bacterium CG10_big_fil_rev_8_21_14_0_10_45_34]
MKKSALVAGGAGFIGSHLVDHLTKRDYTVTVIDNLVTGQRKNIHHLLSNGVRLLEADINEPLNLSEKFDEIYNLASPASPVDFDTMPMFILKTGVDGHRNLLDKAKADGSRILFASTSEVYGDPLKHPQDESYFGNVNCRGPRACYDEAKRVGETLTMIYQKHHQVDTRTVRIFNTYGPRMRLDDGRIVPNFFKQALAGEPLTIHGDGEQTRSFCYVSDLVEGIFLTMQSDCTEPINLGSVFEFKVKDFASQVLKLTRSRSSLEFLPARQDDPLQRRPDISRAETLLGWSPKVALEDGLLKTLEYFSN